jgi:hypothetical protein
MHRRRAVLIPLLLAVMPLIVIMIFWRGGQLFWLLALGILVGGVMLGVKYTEHAPRGRRTLVIGLWAVVAIEYILSGIGLYLLSLLARTTM